MNRPIARHGLSAFLRERRLGEPDGRRLHLYATTVEEMEDLIWYVRAHETFQWRGRDCAALVLVLAEWGYRHATRLQGFWEDASGALGLSFDDAPKRFDEKKRFYERLDEGFAYWKRPTAGTTGRDWIAMLIEEGGLPRNLVTTGLDALLDELFARFSWSLLAAAATKKDHAHRVTEAILRHAGHPRFALFANDAAAPFITELVVTFAAYRRDLAPNGQRPRNNEAIEEWASRLNPGTAPDKFLPFRHLRHPTFVDVLFPRLKSGSTAGGYTQRLTSDESNLRLAAPEQGMVSQWLASGTLAHGALDPASPAAAHLEHPYSDQDLLPIHPLMVRPKAAMAPSDAGAAKPAAPVTITICWPLETPEPLLKVRVLGDGLPKTWVESVAAAMVNSPRLALAPAGLPTLGETFEAVGDTFRPTKAATWCWPLKEARGRALCLSRRTLAGITEIPLGIEAPTWPIVIADSDGKAYQRPHLRAGCDYRVWFPQEPRRIVGDAERISSTTFRFRGNDGSRISFKTDEDRYNFTFSSSPLELDVLGRRWTSHGALGPYIGSPIVRVTAEQPPEFRTSTTTWERLRGGPNEYVLPLPADQGGAVRALIRAGQRMTDIRFLHVPAGTSFRISPPTLDGKRLLSILSRGLTRAALLLGDQEIADSKSEDGHAACLTLPQIESRQRYRVTLSYAHSAVSAPLWDIRRSFRLELGGDSIVLTNDAAAVTTIELAIARYGTIRGTGLRPDETIELLVRSFNRGRQFNRNRSLLAASADQNGDAAIALSVIVDELEPCARHELSLVMHDDARRLVWRIDIDDTVFEREPESGQPYGALAARSTLRSIPPLWGWVPAARQWEPFQSAPMTAVHGGWRPPTVEVPMGGLLAAPFDGEHRVGYIRHLEGAELNAATADSLCLALAKPRGFDLATLRREFSAGQFERDRLRAILTNLSVFNAARSLTVLTISALDGAMLAYTAMRSHSPLGTEGSLRAIPAGAWFRACNAVLQDDGEWIPRINGCAPEAILLIAILAHAGAPVSEAHAAHVRLFAQDLSTRRPSRGRAQADLARADIHSPATLFDYDRRLPTLLDDWRRGDRSDLRQHSVDPEVFEFGIPHEEVREYLSHQYPDTEHFVEAPLALASAAARTTLDPTLSGPSRRLVRTLMYAQRQVRAWARFEPLVGALYLFSLCAWWTSLRSNCSDTSRARMCLERIEIE